MRPPIYRVLLRDCPVDRSLGWVEEVVQSPTARTMTADSVVVRGPKGEANVVWRDEEPKGSDVRFFLNYSPWRSNAHCARDANHALGCAVACDGEGVEDEGPAARGA